jgi:hypothetical protein
LIRLVERVLAVEVVKRDDAARAPPTDERDPEKGLRHLAGQHEAAIALGLGGKVLAE